MVTEISKAEVKRIVDILRLELPGSIVIAPDLMEKRCPECGLVLPHTQAQCDAEIASKMRDYWKHSGNED